MNATYLKIINMISNFGLMILFILALSNSFATSFIWSNTWFVNHLAFGSRRLSLNFGWTIHTFKGNFDELNWCCRNWNSSEVVVCQIFIPLNSYPDQGPHFLFVRFHCSALPICCILGFCCLLDAITTQCVQGRSKYDCIKLFEPSSIISKLKESCTWALHHKI